MTSEIPAIQPVYEASITQPGQVLINMLRAGEKIHPFPNTSPGTQFDNFFDAVIKNLASSASMPPEVLVMKFGENYSASRGALLMFWQVVQQWRAELEADFLAPVYESWLSEEIAAGGSPRRDGPIRACALLGCRPTGSAHRCQTSTRSALPRRSGRIWRWD